MNTKKVILFFAVTVAAITYAHAGRVLHIQNKSVLAIQFTIPVHEVGSVAELEHTESLKPILAPIHRCSDFLDLTIPDGVQHFWINVIPQPLCPEGRCYEPVKVDLFSINAQDAIYHLYATTDTSYLNWIAVFCCYGFVNLPEIVTRFRHVTCIEPDGTEKSDPVFLCLPIYSKRHDAEKSDASREVTSFTNAVIKLTRPQ